MGIYITISIRCLSNTFTFLLCRAALSKSGEIYVWSAQPGASLQPAVLYPNFSSQKVVDVYCCSDHAVVVTETGSVQCFVLSEAFGSRNSHIARAAAQHNVVQALQSHTIHKVWLLAVDRCNPFSCNCCIVALTDKGALYVCPAPSNQQRWMHHLGAVLIKGLDGINFNDFISIYPFLHLCCFVGRRISQVEIAHKFLLVRTDGGQVFGWFPSEKFPNVHHPSGGQSWNSAFQNRWPINVTPLVDLNSSFQGISTDGSQVKSIFFIYQLTPRVINHRAMFITDICLG